MDEVRITIRYMEPQDTEKVAYIEKNNFSEPWPESEFSKTLQDDKYIYIVAADGERIAGYAGWRYDGIYSVYDADYYGIPDDLYDFDHASKSGSVCRSYSGNSDK